MTTKLAPWTPEAYAAITGARYGSLEGQYGSVPTGTYRGHTGRIVEIYPSGHYLLALAVDEEVLVTDSDPRLFEVDLP